MADYFNGLSPAQAERLALLLEELGEAQQAIGKILRHGYESYNPTVPLADRLSNRQALERELGDVMAAMGMLSAEGDIDASEVFRAKERKLLALKPWLHHQER